MSADLVLASTSVYRRELIQRLGLEVRCIAPACDEEALKQGCWTPEELAQRLALAKARSVAALHPDATVIGGDQVCAFGDEVLHKPRTAERAVEQLLRMQGAQHRLVTALVVVHRGQELAHTDITRLTMRPLTRSQLERYVAADQPLDCSGAYKLEKRGIALFERIESADHNAIVGVPLMWLAGTLAQLGYAVP
ncbi:MAG: Maf family protein [Planctomycetes bacterium]|nr:Maf family protein [Planctomycetota bacterium]